MGIFQKSVSISIVDVKRSSSGNKREEVKKVDLVTFKLKVTKTIPSVPDGRNGCIER